MLETMITLLKLHDLIAGMHENYFRVLSGLHLGAIEDGVFELRRVSSKEEAVEELHAAE